MTLRQKWDEFRALPVGRRFISRNRARRSQPGGLLRTCLLIAGGVGLILAGIAMLVLPGPGLIAIALGAALIAEESRLVARLLDRLDLWGTRRWQRFRQSRQG